MRSNAERLEPQEIPRVSTARLQECLSVPTARLRMWGRVVISTGTAAAVRRNNLSKNGSSATPGRLASSSHQKPR